MGVIRIQHVGTQPVKTMGVMAATETKTCYVDRTPVPRGLLLYGRSGLRNRLTGSSRNRGFEGQISSSLCQNPRQKMGRIMDPKET